MSNMDKPGNNVLTPEEKALAAKHRSEKLEEIRRKYRSTTQPKPQENTFANRYGKLEVKIEPRINDDFTEITGI